MKKREIREKPKSIIIDGDDYVKLSKIRDEYKNSLSNICKARVTVSWAQFMHHLVESDILLNEIGRTKDEIINNNENSLV